MNNSTTTVEFNQKNNTLSQMNSVESIMNMFVHDREDINKKEESVRVFQ